MTGVATTDWQGVAAAHKATHEAECLALGREIDVLRQVQSDNTRLIEKLNADKAELLELVRKMADVGIYPGDRTTNKPAFRGEDVIRARALIAKHEAKS